MPVVTLERMESTSSGGAWTPGAAAREQWNDGSRRRRGRWRGASRGVEKWRPGNAAAAEADIFGLLVRVVVAGGSRSVLLEQIMLFRC
jgi:hypothetical protein